MAGKTGLWTPSKIMKLPGISSTCKFILAEIISLSKLPKGCQQTNAGLAEMLNISSQSASRAVRVLTEKKYIRTTNKKTKTGTIRRIYPLIKIDIPTVEIDDTPLVNIDTPPVESVETPLVNIDSHIRNKNTKNKYNTNTITNTNLPAVGNEPTLYKSIESAFLSKTGKFTNYPKEGKSIKGLIAKAENWAPDNPAEFIRDMITRYYELRQSDKFIGKQPFTPSALNSGWLFDRVMIPLEIANDDIDPELDFLFEEKQDGPGNIRSLG